MPKTKTRASRMGYWSSKLLDKVYMLSLLGATENDLAIGLDVSLPTIKKWKQNHKEFKRAIDDGTLGLLSETAKALARRALGFEYDEEVVTFDRSSHSWVHTTKKTFIPPDPWSAARLLELKGRNFGWSVTQNIQLNQTNTNININLSELSTEQLAVLEHISLKQLPQDARNIND
jgi:hypothetical protein